MILKALVGSSVVLNRARDCCAKHILFAAVFSAFLNILYLAPTLYMLIVYDRALPTEGVTTLALVSLVLLFALAVLSTLDWMRSRLLVRISARLELTMAKDVLALAMGAPNISYRKRLQAIRDFDTFRQAIAGGALLSLMDAPWAPIFLGAAFLLHPILGGVALLATVLFVALAFANERATGPELAAASEAAARTYAVQDQTAANAESVRALGMVSALVTRHLRERAEMIALQTHGSFAGGGYVTLTKFLRMALQSGALGIGAYLAITHQISAGAVIAASFLMTRTLAPVEQIVGGWKTIVQARAAARNLDDLFKAGETVGERTSLPPAKGDLRFENVSAAPAEADRLALANVSFHVEPGEILAVVGPSGAGKSTLVRMASGAGQPQAGVIRLDGASLADWPSDRLGQHIGYLPQDFVLFPGTIKDNISRFSRLEDAARGQVELDEKVVSAAKLLGAHEMILRLPRGYDTEIGFNGAGLSAGQRQRVALARAVYGDPSLLVLDEPNANLDSEGEIALANALQHLRQRGAAVLMVVHHGLILRCASRVMILKGGQVQAIGPADRLLRVAPASGPQANAESPQPSPDQDSLSGAQKMRA